MTSKSNGFTLFEVMIAMIILSSSTLLLVSAWSGNQKRIRKMSINYRGAFLLEQKMSQIEIEYLRRFDELPDEDDGDFEDYPKFSWKMETQKFEMPDLSPLLISAGQGNELVLSMTSKLSEYFTESVKELKVTITYKSGKKSVSYAATTFIVNFDKPLPFPNLGGIGGSGSGLPSPPSVQ